MNHEKSINIMLKQLSRWAIVVVSASGMVPSLSAASVNQSHFDTAEQAATTLVTALAQHNKTELKNLFGERYSQLTPADLNARDIKRFIAAWEYFHELLPSGERSRTLTVGRHKWTLPIPIVKGDDGWYFDTETGLDNIRIRHIGTNELHAIQSVLAYHQAQLEYAKNDLNNNGILEYSKKLISNTGQKNGLYWVAEPGETLSPLGSLFGGKTPESAYHGYYYQILKGQGEHAEGGAYSYLVNDNMVQGFALIAWPAEYGKSGIMSFMINRDGTVFEAELGSGSRPTLFDPDSNWTPVSPDFTKLLSN